LRFVRNPYVIAAILLSIVGTVVASSYRRPKVSVTEARRSKLSDALSATGFVESTEITITSKATGRVTDIRVDEGDTVRKGDVLIVLEADEYDAAKDTVSAGRDAAESHVSAASLNAVASVREAPAQVERACAAVSEAEEQLNRLRRGSRREEIQEARAALEETAARVKLAQIQLAAAQVALEQQKKMSAAQTAQAEAALRSARSAEEETVSGLRPQEVAQAESALTDARTRRELAQKDCDRVSRLFAQDAISRQSLDHAESALQVSRQVETQAQEQLSLAREGARTETKKVARAQVEMAEARLRETYAAADVIQVRQKEVEAATQQVRQAEAALRATSARTGLVEKGPRQEDISAASARYDQAKAGLSQARQSLTRASAQREEVNVARAQSRQAAASERQAAIQLKETVIRSPIDGIVSRRLVDIGELVTPTTPLLPGSELLKLVAPNNIWVIAEIDAQDIAKVSTGQSVEVTAEGYPGRVFMGVVKHISAVAEPKPGGRTRARIVRAKIILSKPAGELKPGLEVDVRATTTGSTDALLIPSDAVMQDERGSLVSVVEGRSVRRREVQTGTDNGLTVEALSGLKEGEKVVVRGKERLVSGMRVKVANR